VIRRSEMTTLKIPLINTYLKIEMSVKQKPKVEKLKKELSDFFDKHEIAGIKVKFFKLDENFNIYPDLQGRKLFGNDNYDEEIKAIGQKYCINNLQFYLGCYGK
jgi:predicted nuclease with TOPRIM domain